MRFLHPRLTRRSLLHWSLLAWAACGSVAAGGALAGAPAASDDSALAALAPLERAERVAVALEDAEALGSLRGAASRWLRAVHGTPANPGGRTALELDSLVRSRPDGIRTDLIFVRFGRAIYEAGAAVNDSGPPPFSQQAFNEYGRALERALTKEPANAELYYWQARLRATLLPRFTESSFQMEINYPAGATASARRAVELAPRNERYREALALDLLAEAKPDEAADVMREARGGHHPLARLIADWKLLPAPHGAAPFETDPGDQRAALANRGLDFPGARFRCYSISADAAAVEKLFRQTLPTFRLFAEAPPANGVTHYTNFLEWTDRGLVPADDARQLGVGAAGSGVLVRVTEFRGGEALQFSHVDDPIGDIVCWIYLTNLRVSADH